MESTLLTLAALLPAIVLMIYVFIKDRSEKEPIGLLILLLIMGILSSMPTLFFEKLIGGILDNAFSGALTVDAEGNVMCVTVVDYIYQALSAFIGVGLVEEFFKWLFMFWVTSKSKHFNSLFDGMIYAVFVSLGFAAFENILYVFKGGWTVALLRMIMSVPGHAFFGVFMGYYYTWWNIYNKADKYKNQLVSRHKYKDSLNNPFPTGKFIALSILVPSFVHGLYDFLLFTENGILTLICFALVVFLYITCFRRISKLSKADRKDMDLVQSAVFVKYPDLIAMEQERLRMEEERKRWAMI